MRKNDYEKARDIAEYLFSIAKGEAGEDKEEFEQWVLNNPSAYRFMQKLSNREELAEFLQQPLSHHSKELAAQSLQKKMKQRIIRKRIRFFTKIAAVFFLFLSGGYLLYNNFYQEDGFVQEESVPRIVLGSGEVVLLEQLASSDQGKSEIMEANASELLHCKEDRLVQVDTVMNRLILPAKSRYTIQLPDGTKITVNANSTLFYPNVFTGEQRRVEIQGEAFFDVAKGEKPFVVTCAGVEIKAYGTKFNVNNQHENQVETVLTEGMVGVSMNQGEEVRLSPNQKATAFLNDERISKEDVFPGKYIAWLEGYFLFEGEDLKQVLEKLSQWYGVEFDFSSLPSRPIPIIARYYQQTPLEEILETITLSTQVAFVQQDGKYQMKEVGNKTCHK